MTSSGDWARSLLRVAALLVGIGIALAFCWFGYDGTRAGIRANADLVTFSGFIFFCYGLFSLLLLAAAWATPSPGVRRAALLVAPVPAVMLALASIGDDGITRPEVVAFLGVALLSALAVVGVRLVARGRPAG